MNSYIEAVKETKQDEDETLVDKIYDIKEAMKFLVDKAYDILPEGITKERAKAYWYGQIVTALDNDNNYCGRSMCQMQDTIEELESD
jgi:hypothetical protein